jgi:hypothetical protein
MPAEKASALDSANGSVVKNSPLSETIEIHGHYDVECVGPDGKVKWTDTIENLVVTVGKIDLLDKYFSGSAYTAAWYMGLTSGSTTYALTDTLATHAGWTEDTNYSGSNRLTTTFSGASGTGPVNKVSGAVSFSITGTTTIQGALLCQTQVRATTTGVLYSVGSFTGGPRSVVNLDTLNVTYTASLA